MTLLKKSLPLIVLIVPFLLPLVSKAQKIDTVSTFTISAYIDAYYASYNDSTGQGSLEKFATTSSRNNNLSLNIASISCRYNAEKIRAAFALNYGDIATSSFPHPYNNVLEAHIGFKIYSKLWIDAGFFRPHLGTEFILPVENITTSVAVVTFYEPAYESGVRLNFDPTNKLEINLFLLNGYNMYIDNNNKKSFGMGITYLFGNNVDIGYTNYIGDDTPPSDPTAHLRIHQNVFFNYHRNKIKAQLGGDYCLQQNSDIATHSKEASMYSALATIKYLCTKKFSIYSRGEVFSDPDGFMSTVIVDEAGNYTGYKLWGITAGMEYKPTPQSYVRLEGRHLQMDKNQYIFDFNNSLRNNRNEVVIDAGISFDLLKRTGTRISETE